MVKMISRRALLGTTLGATAALPFVTFGARLSNADTLDDIKKAGTIKVGCGVMGLKPWVWQKEDGSYAGMEYEMLEKMLPNLGVSKFEYVTVEWDALIPG